MTARDARGLIATGHPTLQVTAGSYTIPDQGTGNINAFGDQFVTIGTKLIIWNATTRFQLNDASVMAIGMLAQWQGKRDPATGVVFANKVEIN